MNTALIYLFSFAGGYLSGSIMFSYIITKFVTGKDIRDLGNKNPGAANTFKNIGAGWGILTGLLDAFKALAPVLIGHYYFNLSTIALGVTGFGAIIGHGHPLYFGFRGGRAAACLMGIYLFFIPYELLAAFVIIPVIVFMLIKTNRSYWIPFGIISLSAISCLFFHHPPEIKILVVILGVLGLFLNRFYLPKMVINLLNKRENY